MALIYDGWETLWMRTKVRQICRGESAKAMHALPQRTPEPWMAEAGLFARQDGELRATF